MPFDPRLVGAITWGTWNGGIRLPPYVEHVLDGAELTAEVADDGTHHVTWVTDSSRNTKQEFWFDPARDYVPVRYAVVTRSHANAEWKQPLEQGETTWREVNGIWVPATTEHNEPNSKHPRRRSYTFEWLSVNRALPPDTFDLQSVPLPPGVEVFDHYERRQNARQRNGERERRPPPATQSSTKDAPPLWSPQIAVTGLLAFVLVALLFTTRRSS
ncbi:hypothetical protein [Posidoniimonas corsicana]|nr:hypothetical protein [Posidoniimonas corsicana]